MPSLFRKRKEPYNLRSRKNAYSAPKSKVDACVECDLPFDESTIAPELRRGPIDKPGTSSEPLETCEKDSEGVDKTNLEPLDISVESNSEDSFSVLAPPCLSNPAEKKNHLEKGTEKEKENCTENAFVIGGQPVPVSTSPQC